MSLNDYYPHDKPSHLIGFKLNNEIDCFKARLIAKGYTQKPSIDYFDMFASVVKLDTVHIIISLAAYDCWRMFQMDIKSTRLNGMTKEKVYVDRPPRYMKGEKKVSRLKKASYGFK